MTELEKWSKVHESARAIEEFIDYLSENGLNIGKISNDGTFLPSGKTHLDMIYECYNINANQLEKERRDLIKKAVVQQNSSKVEQP